MTDELPPAVHARLTAFTEEGNRLLQAQKHDRALEKFEAAWRLLPDPKEVWEAATWIQAAAGDAHWFSGRYEQAQSSFLQAERCPGGIENPFIHLRLGQCAYELGDLKRAKEQLTLAYMGAGKEIFEEDPKYFELLKDTLALPPGSESL